MTTLYPIQTLTCPLCRDYEAFLLPIEEVRAYNSTGTVANLRSLTMAQRERFISGMCPTCWDKIFSEEE